MGHDIINTVKKYYGEVDNYKYTRPRSWENCYKHFENKPDKNNEEAIDLAALNLAMYLASWGMYRGSSFLLDYDYKIHIPIIKNIIIRDDVYKFRGAGLDEVKESLFEISDHIKRSYSNNGVDEECILDIAEEKSASDTLVTKILLGTLGCIPAYDRFFKIGLHYSANDKIAENSKLNAKNLNHLIKWCEKYEDSLKEAQGLIQQKSDTNYPITKIVDIYFWQVGREISKFKEDIKKNKDKEKNEKELKKRIQDVCKL